jgi:hypothetical protein
MPDKPLPDPTIQRTHFTVTSEPSANGFDVVMITAGCGNGWIFSPEVLRESLSLWEGVECFVDHNLQARSVKDLAGVFHSAIWDEVRQGIRAHLKTMGPSALILQELGKTMVGADGVRPPIPPADDVPSLARPAVGFSADIIFKAIEKTVTKILRVLSVDLVVDPARGGEFIRQLNQIQEEIQMPEPKEEPKQELETLRNLLTVQQEQTALAAEAEKTRAIRAQMCEYLLTSGLAAGNLPTPAAERVRKQFAGKVFEPADLNSAIEDARALVSELTAASVVQGPGRISGMTTNSDQLQAAADDLLGAPRDEDKKSVHAARLSGIRELYMLLTGDYDLHGGYHPGRVQLATTADFTGLVKNALNKIIVKKWEELGKAGYTWWEKIVQVEHFNSLMPITGTLVGTVGSLPVVAEGAAYTELLVGDSPETAAFTKYGGYIPLTLELIDRDETRKLAAYPRELAVAGLRKVSELVAGIFTAAAGLGPTMADTGTLFNANAVTAAAGHANLLTAALSAAQWEAVSAAMYIQPQLIKNSAGIYGTGPKMGINPRFLLVPRALQLIARQVLYPSWQNAVNITSENLQQGQPGDVLTVPEWTDVTDWAAVIDPALAPAIFVGERFGIMPEVFIAGDNLSPAVFTNDETRLKVRHFLAVWVNDFRPLHKENVLG